MSKKRTEKKLLVVIENLGLMHPLRRVLGDYFEEIIFADHDNALDKFFSKKPTHVLIFDYSEIDEGPFSRGYETYFNIKNKIKELVGKEIILVRCGFENYSYSDYIKVPFLIEELYSILGL